MSRIDDLERHAESHVLEMSDFLVQRDALGVEVDFQVQHHFAVLLLPLERVDLNHLMNSLSRFFPKHNCKDSK